MNLTKGEEKVGKVLLCVLWALLLQPRLCHCYEEEEVVHLRAAAGRDAYLPCGQEKVFLDGPGSYAAWMREDHFIYRFPNDDTETDDGYDAKPYYGDGSESCEGRSRGCVDRTSLLIKGVTVRDAGLYSCRVHYQASPSVDYVINVQVVESPRHPHLSAESLEVTNGYVGPLALGTEFKLVCELPDADNSTILYWRRNGVALPEPPRRRPLAIDLAGTLTRDELDAHYECAAQNSDVSEPVVAALAVKMYLPPLSVEIRLNDNRDFAAGEPRVVDCVVVGCVPPPTITWHLGNKLLKPNTHKEHHEGNFTVSSLSLSPALSDQGAELVCRALNPYLKDQRFEHSVTINVGYKPVCLRSREEIVGLVDGVSESVACAVEAAPEPLKFTWTFESSRKAHTTAQRLPGHQHRYSSTLNFVATAEDIGTLECRAANSFGSQERPCTYRLVRGGPPDTPVCLLLRSYPGAARIECKKGYDGGRPQMVHLQITTEEGALVSNHSNSLGHFHLQQLKDQRNLTAVIFASSSRGISAAVTLYLQNFAPVTLAEASGFLSTSRFPLAVPALEAVAALALAAGAVAAARAWRARRRARETTEVPPGPDVVLLCRTDGSFHREPDFLREESLSTTGVAQFKTCRMAERATPCGSILCKNPHTSVTVNAGVKSIQPSNSIPVAVDSGRMDSLGHCHIKTFYV